MRQALKRPALSVFKLGFCGRMPQGHLISVRVCNWLAQDWARFQWPLRQQAAGQTADFEVGYEAGTEAGSDAGSVAQKPWRFWSRSMNR